MRDSGGTFPLVGGGVRSSTEVLQQGLRSMRASSTRAAATWMATGALGSACMGAVIRLVRDDIDWRVLVFARSTLGLAFALGILRLAKTRVPFPGPRELWLRTSAGACGILCSFYAATTIPVADAIVLVNSSPLWIALLSATFLRRRPERSVWIALAAGTLGMVAVSKPHFEVRNLGALAGVAAGCLAAVSLLAISRMRHVPSTAVVVHANVGFVAASTVILLSSEGTIDTSGMRSLAVVAVLFAIALLATITQFAYTRALSTGSASHVAPVQFLAIAFAVGFDVWVFGDPPSSLTLVGLVLVVGPAIWIMRAPRAPLQVRGRSLSQSVDLPAERLPELEEAVRRAERTTSCEIRVHVERTCPDPTARPQQVFDQLGMERTKQRNALLVYVAVESRHVAIVVDEGISNVVPPLELDAVCARLFAPQPGPDFVGATADGIVAMLTLLGRWFPYQPDDVNELDDSISVVW